MAEIVRVAADNVHASVVYSQKLARFGESMTCPAMALDYESEFSDFILFPDMIKNYFNGGRKDSATYAGRIFVDEFLDGGSAMYSPTLIGMMHQEELTRPARNHGRWKQGQAASLVGMGLGFAVGNPFLFFGSFFGLLGCGFGKALNEGYRDEFLFNHNPYFKLKKPGAVRRNILAHPEIFEEALHEKRGELEDLL